jgi:hypothetical protein
MESKASQADTNPGYPHVKATDAELAAMRHDFDPADQAFSTMDIRIKKTEEAGVAA